MVFVVDDIPHALTGGMHHPILLSPTLVFTAADNYTQKKDTNTRSNGDGVLTRGVCP